MKKKLLFISFIALFICTRIVLWIAFTPTKQPPQANATHVEQTTPVSFHHLPGWQSSNVVKSLQAFQKSCALFLKKDPNHLAGSQHINLTAKDWQPACQEAKTLTSISNQEAKAFFERWFRPVEFYHHKPVQGLFTGYYMPSIPGSLVKTSKYRVPIYGMPSNLITAYLKKFNPKYKNQRAMMQLKGKKMVPFYTREEINHGALNNKAPVIAWIESEVDRLFLEIEGSGTIELPNNQSLYLTYAGENGAQYTSIAKIMIQKGILSKDKASYSQIKAYLESHPKEKNQLLNQNKSFVFFQKLKENAALGAQGIPLTKGYSLAVDREWIPLGTPLWLNTTKPTNNQEKLQRLMIAQDTGGAIKGKVRGDIFYGAGEQALKAAANMQNKGRYWLLLPKHIAMRLKHNFAFKLA